MNEIISPKLLSSAKISFLFGSGVNGNAFPQLSGFGKTIEILKQELNLEDFDPKLMEKTISNIKETSVREKIFSQFKQELVEFNDLVDYTSSSIKSLKEMFVEINKLVQFEENRTIRTKQVNIFTLNYDNICFNVLEESGMFVNQITPNNVKKKTFLYSLIGHDFLTKRNKTSFLISKIHGEISEPIVPGLAKYGELIAEKYFELLFNMKTILKQPNSVLFVIGYSGNDEHINQLIIDCVDSGLTIFWFLYSANDRIPILLKGNTFQVDQEDYENPQDPTRMLFEMVRKLWVNK